VKVLLIDEVASLLRCSADDVLAEIESGNLKGFRVAGNWRVLESGVERFVSGASQAQEYTRASSVEGALTDDLQQAESGPQRSYTIRSEPMTAFTYTWPDGELNTYKDPLSITVENLGRRAYFVIGKAKSPRKQLGQLRWRYNIFLTSKRASSQGLISVLDFVAGNDFDQDSLMVSLIRHADGKLVKENDVIPSQYRGFRLAPFNEVVRGPYARSGLAVVADKDDLETMIRHSVIRSGQKGWLRW
jgi:hypothetical protein